MREKFARFMMGRYGVDALSRTLTAISMILLIVSLFGGPGLLYYFALILLVVSYARMFSRNIPKRYRENQLFLEKTGGVRRFFRVRKSHFDQRGVYRFYHCPQCHQSIRVPKGRGRIAITCPKCGLEFIKKS